MTMTSDTAPESAATDTRIAIVGMAGRFPGARNVQQFWDNLKNGRESVTFFTEDELLAAGEQAEQIADPSYVRAWPVLDDIDRFDAAFFGLSPRDAALMDPQHRFFLEVAWLALENAGYSAEQSGAFTGVFAACGMNSYMMHHLVRNRQVMETVGEWLVRHTGNDMNFLATRVSYQMNLRGPSLNVQTACSSALVAVHLACQSLLNHECDMALAGASTMSLPQDRGYLFNEGEILAPDGHCRPFDAAAGGTLFGSGTGCVVLKRLVDALDAGDQVLAVICGSAINNDGSSKVGYLAPSVEGQARAVSEALAISGVDPETISYVEAHGTGTAVGDPIEVAALTQAYAAHTDKRGYCALGSLKGNIGHLGEAAGIASLIKTILALQHRQLPPSINYQRPNQQIPFDDTPFFVNTQLREWARQTTPRRAGITALGAGGTNVHLVLEEAPLAPPATKTRAQQLFVLSAKSKASLEQALERLAEHLASQPDVSLADAAYTLQVGRKHFNHRCSFVADGVQNAVACLRSADPKQLTTQVTGRSAPSVVFMFPGGGAQYAGMGAELYAQEPSYRAAFDECLAALPADTRARLRALVLADPASRSSATLELERPALALPALFATEYATAKLLTAWGLEPAAFIGHSMGEYVAACLAGVFTVSDGMALVSERGRLFESLPQGGMLSVGLSEDELRPLLGAELSVAAANAPTLCVASGPVAAIDALTRLLTQREVDSTRIHISVAAHSQMLEPIIDAFTAFCRRIRFEQPKVPFVSNLTGSWITPAEATDPSYWARHLRSTVRFADGIATLVSGSQRVLLEVGPGRTLCSLARQHPSAPGAHPALRHPQEAASDVQFLLQALGKVWCAGVTPDFERLHRPGKRLRTALPGYAFESQRYWLEPDKVTQQAPKVGALRKQADVKDWFHAPSWRRAAVPAEPCEPGIFLVFCDSAGLCERLIPRLKGARVIQVTPGESFAKLSDDRYDMRVDVPADYDSLLTDLGLRELLPRHIVYAWPVTPARSSWPLRLLEDRSPLTSLGRAERSCFFGLLWLAQALGAHEVSASLSIISTGLHGFEAAAQAAPEKALLLGPTRVIPRELPQLRSRSIDVVLPERDDLEPLLALLVDELTSAATEQVVALRASGRWTQSYESVPVPSRPGAASVVRKGGVYLITGGLGGVGLELAEHLGRSAGAKLILVSRTGLPDRSKWAQLIAESDPVAPRLRKVQAIEAAGAEVMVASADVTSMEDMQEVVAGARKRFGAIHGVVHSAGLIDDGLISLKAQEAASRVLAVKTRGTLMLEAALGEAPLDFFVVFSSVSAVLGLEGQVDYTAANAFLDAFAESRSARGTPALSIGWNAWRDVGMAASLAEQPSGAMATASSPAAHPALERLVADEDALTIFATSFGRNKHWLLSEHVVRDGTALIPGTGYLELARAAFQHRSREGQIELCDLAFLSPFAVAAGTSRELRLQLSPDGSDAVELRFYSESKEEPHVTGRARRVNGARPKALDLEALAAACDQRERAFGGFLEQAFMDFGPRWANVDRIRYGVGQALLFLSLPESFVGDLQSYELHPALMDMATGGAQALLPGFEAQRDFFVPIGYGRVTVYAALTPRCRSHVRLKPTSSADIARFDASVCDEQGNVLVEVVDFTMKRVTNSAALESGLHAASAATSATSQKPIESAVRLGITNPEGMAVFERLLSAGFKGAIVASSVNLADWLSEVESRARPPAPALDTLRNGEEQRSEPNRELVAPRNDIERELAKIWHELLGLTSLSVRDDFFEVGGTSLVAVRLFNKIRKKYGVSLPLSTLFEAPNIEGCAKIIAEELGISLSDDELAQATAAPAHAQHTPHDDGSGSKNGAAPADLPSLTNGEHGARQKKTRWPTLVVMQPKGRPPAFFCIAGLGGNLNHLRKLAILAGDARPIYGLQPPGADDPSKLIYSVPELAEHYLAEIKAVQPTGPYFLGGYSGGGIAAFEICHRLTAMGEQVALLGLIDSYSPELPQRSAAERARIHFERLTNQGPAYALNTLKRRAGYQRYELQRLVSRRLRNLFPDRFRYEQVEDSWLVAQAAYKPPPWQGRATLFRAREMGSISLWTAVKDDDTHGWDRYLLGGVDVQFCPGNHNTMCEEPNVRVLARLLGDALRRAAEQTLATPAALSAPGPAATLV